MKLTKQRKKIVNKIIRLGSLSGRDHTDKSMPLIEELRILNPLVPELRKVAWEVFRHYIFNRDTDVCITCGGRCSIITRQASHLIHRNCYDYDEIIVNTQCNSCHLLMKVDTAMPIMYRNSLEARFIIEIPSIGDMINRKIEERNKLYKPTRTEIWEVIEKYRIREAE